MATRPAYQPSAISAPNALSPSSIWSVTSYVWYWMRVL